MIYAYSRQEIKSLLRTSIRGVLEQVGKRYGELEQNPSLQEHDLALQQFWNDAMQHPDFYAMLLEMVADTKIETETGMAMKPGLDIPSSLSYWNGQKYQQIEAEAPLIVQVEDPSLYRKTLEWVNDEQKKLFQQYSHIWEQQKPLGLDRETWMHLVMWMASLGEEDNKELQQEHQKSWAAGWMRGGAVWKEFQKRVLPIRGRSKQLAALSHAYSIIPEVEKIDKATNEVYETFWGTQQHQIASQRKRLKDTERRNQHQRHNAHIQLIIHQIEQTHLSHSSLPGQIDTINGVGVLLSHIDDEQWVGWDKLLDMLQDNRSAFPSYLASVAVMMDGISFPELKIN